MIDYYERICCAEVSKKTYRCENHWETFDCPATIVRSNGCFASSWNDDDYAEMAKTPFDAPVFVEVPTEEVESILDKYRSLDEELEFDAESASVRAKLLAAESTGHTRIHITQYEKSKYVKGSSKNFEVKGNFEVIFGLLSPLRDIFVGDSSTRVRVQLQNKVEGGMCGGRNLSLSGALVPDVYNRVAVILDENGLIASNESGAVVSSKPSGISLEQRLKEIARTLDNLEQKIRDEAAKKIAPIRHPAIGAL